MSDIIHNGADAGMWERARKIYIATLRNDEERGQVERSLSMIRSISLKDGTVTFLTATAFAADLLKRDYTDRIRTCLELAGAPANLKVEFEVDASAAPEIVVTKVPVENPPASVNRNHAFISTMPLRPDYTFAEFVRGPSNSIAHAAALSVADKPGRKGYNPLFIHGGTGLGKTHLMQAIGNELKSKNPGMAVCYLTSEVFFNEYVNALQNGKMEQFHQRYRSIDVLLLDDIQFVANKKQFQEEFFNTFNSLYAAQHQIVITSDVAPKQLNLFEPRLLSRFEGGMVLEIELPSYETRLAILRKKAETMTPKVPDNALKFIAENIKSHVRAMEGALSKVNVMLSMNSSIEMTDDLLYQLLKDFIEKEKSLKKITIEEIQNTICSKYGVTLAQLLSSERTQSIVTPRQLAMYISRKFTTKSLPEIAKMFDKSHATILHGVRTIEKRLDVEADLKATMMEITTSLGYSPADSAI